MDKRILAVLAATICCTLAIPFTKGKCNEWSQIPKFLPNPVLLNTTLYLRRSLHNYLFEKTGGECSTGFVSVKGNIMTNSLSQYRQGKLLEFKEASADLLDPKFLQTTVFDVKFKKLSGQSDVSIPVVLLATDQRTYAVLYSCRNFPSNKKLEMALVFVKPQFNPSTDNRIRKELDAVGLNYNQFKQIDTTKCIQLNK